eukprot:1114823-Karenia_brevis.AAC.1
MRASLVVERYGQRVTRFTRWSDSKIVVDGYRKGKSTLQSALVIDWEELWDRVDALDNRGIHVYIKK